MIIKAVPAGIAVIDLSNQTVLPGLINCHVHFLINQTSAT
jgi:imidazolonepropionase-like amidohydrolase